MDANLMKSIAEKHSIGKAKFGKVKERREYIREIGMLETCIDQKIIYLTLVSEEVLEQQTLKELRDLKVKLDVVIKECKITCC